MFILRIKDKIKRSENLQFVLDLFRVVLLGTSIFSIVIPVLLSISYLFLYGFYFSSADIAFIPSYISIIIFLIPFNRLSLLIIATFLLISIGTISISLNSMLKNKKILIFPILLLFACHISLTLFFVNGNLDYLSIVQFLIIWVIPVYFAILFLWSNAFYKYTLWASSLTAYGILASIYILYFFKNYDILLELLIPLFIFLLGSFAILLNKIKPKRLYTKCFIFTPFFAIILIIIIAYAFSISNLELIFPFKITIHHIYIFSFFLSYIISYLILKSGISKKLRQKRIIKQPKVEDSTPTTSAKLNGFNHYLEIFKKNKNVLITLVLLILIISISTLPMISVNTGKYFRNFVDNDTLNISTIYNKETDKTYMGIVVAEKNGVYYISTTEKKILILDSSSITIESLK